MRTVPPGWGMDLYAGNLLAGCRVTVRDFPTWAQLPDDETWADQDPAATWAEDIGPITVLSPTGGTLTKDWSGPGARGTATVDLPPTAPGVDQVIQGKWLAILGYLDRPDGAPIDLDTAPHVTAADLYITGMEWDQTAGTVQVTADDLVTLLGARELDHGNVAGPTGYLPAARTAHGVIRELVDVFAPMETLVTDDGAPDAPWTPTVDDDTGIPEPLTGGVWSAIEAMATLAGLTIIADGPRIILAPANRAPEHSGLTITETASSPGIQSVAAIRNTDPAFTTVIATGRNAAGVPVAGRAHDPATLVAQGFAWDASISVPGQVDTAQCQLAAIAHLDYLRGQQQSGRLDIPWLPMLDPGDVVTVAWHTAPTDAHYIHSMTLPLNPAEPVALTLRGYSWPTWAEEPPGATWAQTDPALTWAADT